MDLTSLIPSFGNLAFTLAAFTVALLIIVAIHEFGHYIVGRWTGIHAETYSLGFGPVLWSRADRRGTKWQIAAIPLGGYVKFLGDANPSSLGGEEVSGVNPRNTMLGAPVWARALTVAAGPMANFILTVVLLMGVMAVSGRMVEPLTIKELAPLPPVWENGLRPGDAVLEINGLPATTQEEFGVAATQVDGPARYTVERDGAEHLITVAPRRTDLPTANGMESRWLIGITAGGLIEPTTESPGLWALFTASLDRLWYIISMSLSGMWQMITGAISTCNLSSPVGIADTSGAMASQGTVSFIGFIAFLSAAVGLFNLLPIPILDGGHLLFHAYEAIVGKPPSPRAVNIAMRIGIALLFAVMGLALMNDLFLCR